jgi:hypothetical protein
MIQIGNTLAVASAASVEAITTDRHGNVLPTIIINPEAPEINWKSYDFADAFLSAMASPTSDDEEDIITLCEDLASAGTLSKFLWLAPYVGGNAADHALNLKYPFAKGGQKATYIGSPTHNANGIQGGSGISALCGISLSMLDPTNFSMGLYSLDSAIASTVTIEMMFGATAGYSGLWLSTHASTGGSCAFANAAYGNKLTFSPTNAAGQFDCVLSSTRKAVFRNGVQQATGSTNLGFIISTYDNFRYLLSDRRIAMHYIGEHFTDTELADNYTIFQAFQTARGRNV